jgi:PhoH-like ATPase
MLTQKKIYILDTNVILYEPNIFELFEENIIVLPFTLLQEIDKFKSESSTRGYNSREFIRQLNKVFQWKQNIEFTAKDTHFKYLKNQLKDQNIIILYNTNIESLNISNDDKIIKYSLELNNILSTQIQLINEIIPNIKDYAILITKDINMRIKAQVQNIKTEDFRNKKQSLSSNNHSKYLISESSFDLLNNSTTPVNIKDIEFIEEETENIQKTFFNNKYLQLISNKKTILCRYNTNKIFKLNYPIKSKELKINPKNIHQEFLFDFKMCHAHS